MKGLTGREPRVLMLLGKDVSHDARVRRAAHSLAKHGYRVVVACTSDDGSSASWNEEGFRVVSVPIRLLGPEIDEVKRALEGVQAEQREVAASLQGRLASLEEEARLNKLRRDERALRRRHRSLVNRPRDPLQLDKSYRDAWAEALRTEEPDVIHVHDHHGLAAALSVKGATRVIYDAHELEIGKDVKLDRRSAMFRYLFKHVPKTDAVITVGSALADALMDQLRLAARPAVVHNAPVLDAGSGPPYELRDQLGLVAGTPLLVYAGGFNRRRRLLTPIQALLQLPGVHLAIILAKGKGADELGAAAEELGLSDRVHFPPPVPHESVVSVIRAADVGIHPLERSANADIAMPNKLFEYLQAGLPMVVSDCKQMAAFVERHRLGAVASVDDPDAWAVAIRRVLDDPSAYTNPRRRRRLRDEWSWEAQERVLLDLYARLLEPKDAAWYDRVYAKSEEYRKPYRQSMYYECWTRVADRVLARRPSSVLELGCGTGQFAALLRDRGLRGYLGVDFSSVAVEHARETCPDFRFQVADIRSRGALRHDADVVVCLETLEHLEDDCDVIRRLRPGTRLVATVPDFPAKAHMRWFGGEEDVAERYSPLLRDLEIERCDVSRKATFFLLEGIRVD